MGAIGATGPAGSPGLPGTPGLMGLIGPIGPTGPAGLEGTPGATGPTGATGSTGSTGPAGPSLSTTLITNTTVSDPNPALGTFIAAGAVCPTGTVVSGGYRLAFSGAGGTATVENGPFLSNTGWFVQLIVDQEFAPGVTVTLTTEAICPQ